MTTEIQRVRERLRIKPRILLTAVIVTLALVIAMVPENTTQPYKLSAADMLTEIQYGSELIHPDQLAEWLINQDPAIRLIDVRTPEEFDTFHLEQAVNIPQADILSAEWTDYLDQGIKMNILYSNGTTGAQQIWMILRQLGYHNNYVLQGGLNYWVETILNPAAPKVTSPDDEFARYDFRQAASRKFGGGSAFAAPAAETESTAPKPPIKQQAKKKAPEGGC
ncbi:MAG: rhodanese-like domain-containing protein [Candidatus Neomarinimicrobiota bacterium]